MTERSGVFGEEDVYGKGITSLMLPDYVNCHDWAYLHAWDAAGYHMKLIQAHMVGDWYVHFGPRRTEPRRKEGWAYRRMRPAALLFHEFFARSAAEGLRSLEAPPDSVRGFSHSMLEYTIDTYLARRGVFDDHLSEAQSAISALEDVGGVRRLIEDVRIEFDAPDLPAEILSYRTRAQRAADPEFFAYYAAARKFGLVVSEESAAFVRSYIDRILSQIDHDEIDVICRNMAAAIADPDRMPRYDVPFDVLIEGAR